MRDPILAFVDDYEPFSNFHRGHPVTVFGRTWPTTEHPFQAAKFFGMDERVVDQIHGVVPPGLAKKLGRSRSTPIRPDWDLIAPSVMMLINLHKFTQHDELRALLVGTEDATLVEGNDHRDRTWGAIWERETLSSLREGERTWADERDAGGHMTGRLVGKNMLGRTLMILRRDLV